MLNRCPYPPGCLAKRLRACRLQYNTPIRFVDTTSESCSVLKSMKGWKAPLYAALLIHTSTLPNVFKACSSSRCTSMGSDTLHAKPCTFERSPHSRSRSCMAASRLDCEREVISTWSPALSSSLAIALPKPLLPPVSTTVRGRRGATCMRTLQYRSRQAKMLPIRAPAAAWLHSIACTPCTGNTARRLVGRSQVGRTIMLATLWMSSRARFRVLLKRRPASLPIWSKLARCAASMAACSSLKEPLPSWAKECRA
mmetsp:Transcript_6758/g.18117  ORF Transcript_6758/g.18117 Transcript_6758/m.18117 type:complete len:254 (-) Transcript_6758:413-1174(-)